MLKAFRLAITLVAIVGGVAACGKRGVLEPPSGATPSQASAAQSAAPAAGAEPAKAGAPPAHRQTRIGGNKRVPLTAPKRDLPIDWILE